MTAPTVTVGIPNSVSAINPKPSSGVGSSFGYPNSRPKSGGFVLLPLAVSGSNNSNLLVNGTEIMYPLPLNGASTFQSFSTNLNAPASAGSLLRFGVRTYAGVLITDYGTVPATGAFSSVTLSVGAAIVAGEYLATMTQQGAPATACTVNGVESDKLINTTPGATASSVITGTGGVGYTATGVVGALPSTPTLTPTLGGSSATSNPCFAIGF